MCGIWGPDSCPERADPAHCRHGRCSFLPVLTLCVYCDVNKGLGRKRKERERERL